MIRNSKRSIRLLSWRTLRWAIAVPTLPLVWWACTSHPLTQPTPAPEQQTDIYISVSPTRLLDLVFMVDNSPSMAPKVVKMNAQFPKLIEALRDPTDNTLPDLRVAILDSDLGTGNQYTSGSCGPKTLPDGTSYFGDKGRFQMIGATACGVTSPDATYLETKGNTTLNFTGDINTVFACLAGNLGTLGCGEEHQLQAFEFAFVVSNLGPVNDKQREMLRGNAYLGLVFLTDEDDCSAAPNDGMFGQGPPSSPGPSGLGGESASLRCYTRSHYCEKNLTDAPPGYPTSAAFSTNLTKCSARVGDTCDGVDVSQPTTCNPLRDVKVMADEIKSLKDDPDNQILVAGIFGWPLTDAEVATAQYKIDLIPNPNTADTAHPTVYDTWPICYDPGYRPANASTYDAAAAGQGATPGLRLASFVDEFNLNGSKNGLKFSICQTNFAASMKVIGDAIAKKLQNLCVNYKLWHDPNGAPDCRVVYRTPSEDPTDKTKVIYTESPVSMPMCKPTDTSATLQKGNDCWKLTPDKTKCPDAYNGQLITVLRPQASIDLGPLTAGTKVGMQCRTCTDFKAVNPDNGNLEFLPGCNY